jgi:hypothetical protein
MVVSREEAARALADIGSAQARTERLVGYRQFAPHAMIWGAVWMLANGLIELLGGQANLVWLVLVIAGISAGVVVGARQQRRAQQLAPARSGEGWRWAATSGAVFLYFQASFAVLPPSNPAQIGPYIALFFAAAYVLFGIWAGWKIMALGLVMVALILGGYFSGSSHAQQWSQAVAGAAMVLGGWWMRRA